MEVPPYELEYTEVEYKRKKEKSARCKIISMNVLNIPFNKDTTDTEKFLLFREMERWFDRTDEEIVKKFNEVCSAKMLNFEDLCGDV